jgi:hypothetical protein
MPLLNNLFNCSYCDGAIIVVGYYVRCDRRTPLVVDLAERVAHDFPWQIGVGRLSGARL